MIPAGKTRAYSTSQRNVRVSVCLTSEEAGKIREAAWDERTSVSEWIRARLGVDEAEEEGDGQ